MQGDIVGHARDALRQDEEHVLPRRCNAAVGGCTAACSAGASDGSTSQHNLALVKVVAMCGASQAVEDDAVNVWHSCEIDWEARVINQLLGREVYDRPRFGGMEIVRRVELNPVLASDLTASDKHLQA